MSQSNPPSVAYFGHPKSASSWLAGFMMRTAKVQGKKFWQGQLILPRFKIDAILELRPEVIITQNSEIEKCLALGVKKAFHVIRDPRDIIVSSYFSYGGTHTTEGWPELLTLRDELRSLSIEDGLERMMKFNERDLLFMKNWNYSLDHILELKYEDMIADMPKHLYKAMEHIGWVKEEESSLDEIFHFYNRVSYTPCFSWLPAVNSHGITSGFVNKLNDEINIDKLKKKKPSAKNHYRSGTSGDWCQYFTPKHKALFTEMYGDLLIDLGYEESNKW